MARARSAGMAGSESGWSPHALAGAGSRGSVRQAQVSGPTVAVHEGEGGAAGPREQVGPLHVGGLPGGVASCDSGMAPARIRCSKCDDESCGLTQPAWADPPDEMVKATRAKSAPAISLASRVRVDLVIRFP